MPKVTKHTTIKTTNSQPSKSVINRIQSVRKLPIDHIKINIYGRSGSGKTTVGCTFPKPLLLIGAEDGTRSVRDMKGVQFIHLQKAEEIVDLIKHQKKDNPYKTIVLDSLTSYQDMLIKEALGIDEITKISHQVLEGEHWQNIGSILKDVIIQLFSLKSHLVILAQEREFNTDEDNELLTPYVQNDVIPHVSKWINPKFDYQTNTFIRQRKVKLESGKKKLIIEHCLRTGPHPTFVTKFRVPKGTKIPDAIVNPEYKHIKALIV